MNLDKQKAFLEKRADMNAGEIIEQEMKVWTRSAPADLYYERDTEKPLLMRATDKLRNLCDQVITSLQRRINAPSMRKRLLRLLDRIICQFEEKLIRDAEEAKKQFPAYQPPRIKRLLRRCKGVF